MESEDTFLQEIAPYVIGKLVPLPLFKDLSNDNSGNLLQQCIKKDITWSIAGELKKTECHY